MGHKQVLRVNAFVSYHVTTMLTFVAKFQIRHNARFCQHSHGKLGDHTPVWIPALELQRSIAIDADRVLQTIHLCSYGWRDRSAFLGLYRRCDWSVFGLCQHRGNGINVRRCTVWLLHCMLIIYGRSPTAGGQYHWVSEFAPPKIQKLLSYLTGKSTASYIERIR